MALTLEAAAKHASANSYATQAEATTYFEGRPNVANWTGASSGDKDVALVAATSRIEQERFVGTATTTTQRLQWPRNWAEDRDGNYYDEDVVPRPVKEACFELALAVLNSGTKDFLADSGIEGYDAVSVGPISVTPRHAQSGGELPANVKRLLAGLRTTRMGTMRLSRS